MLHNDLSGENGFIESPLYESHISASILNSRTWRITVEHKYLIAINFKELYTSNTNGCEETFNVSIIIIKI